MKETEKTCEIKFEEDTLFVGDKGLYRVTGTCGSAMLLPVEKQTEYPKPAKTLPRAHGGPIEDLFYCVKNGGTPCSNFSDASAPLTAFALAGHLAQFVGVGKKLEWNVEKMQCTNDAAVNKYLRREYRKGWEV
jgi:hypothetical protein